MNKKTQKGQYGYRMVHKKMQLSILAVGIVCILAQLAARNFTSSQDVKNILTVMAILSVLPVANIASPFLAALPYQTPSRRFYEMIQPFENRYSILYDLILTSKEQIMPVDAVVIDSHGVYAFCPKQKMDLHKAESYLNDLLKNYRLHISIFTDERAFIKRLENLAALEKEGDYNYTAVEQLFKSHSM